MSGNKLLLDTNAVLYLLNGDETLADFLEGKELYISIITELEILSYKKITEVEQLKISEFLGELIIINITNEIKKITIELRKNFNLKLPDSIIAATATSLEMPFITSDKQFKTITNLNLIYYEK